MSSDVLPDFVGLGALKAGTTYLDAMLRGHPQLSLPTHVKEVNYFTAHYERGPEWYETQFASADGKPRGEISPQYLFDARSPGRIAAANPAARLLVSVRQPVDRTYSQYRHWVQETGYRGDFDAFLGDHPEAAERSRYWLLLQRFRAEFPDEQLHVLVFEDLVAEPRRVLADVYAFLGVDPEHVPEATDTAVNASGSPRFRRAYTQSKRVTSWLYAHGAGRTVERVKRTGIDALLRGRGRPDDATPPLPEATAASLATRFRDDVAELGEYLGRDLSTLWGIPR